MSARRVTDVSALEIRVKDVSAMSTGCVSTEE